MSCSAASLTRQCARDQALKKRVGGTGSAEESSRAFLDRTLRMQGSVKNAAAGL